jgi:DtxR family Mn-dependent transcriptional regulator
MQVTDTIQDYLKTIYSIARAGDGVHTTAIAGRLNVSPASVTSMMKKLSSLGYLTYTRYQGVELTDSGTEIALEVIRHHRLLELYLHHSLGIPWDRVHDEAEVLEHAISEDVEDAIAKILEQTEPGPARVERVSDRDPEVLRHLAKIGLQPGTEIVIERKDPYGGPVWVKVGKKRHAVGTELTTKVYVSKVEQ